MYYNLSPRREHHNLHTEQLITLFNLFALRGLSHIIAVQLDYSRYSRYGYASSPSRPVDVGPLESAVIVVYLGDTSV